MKVRKQFGSQHVRSKSIRENSNPVNHAIFTPNNFISGEFGKFNNASSVDFNFNLRNSDCGNSVDFVFGDSKSNLESNSNLIYNKSVGTSIVHEPVKFDKVSYGLGDREPSGKGGKLDFGGFTKFRENFVFDYNMAKLSSPGGKESTENVGRYHDKREKAEKETESEFRKVDDVDFVFAACDRDTVSNSSLEKKESNPSFVLGAGGNDMRSFSHSKRVEANRNVGNSFSIDIENRTSTTSQGGNLDNVVFVFGACKSDSASIADVEIRESRVTAEELNFVDMGKMNVDSEAEHQNSKVNGVFLFGSARKGSSGLSGSSQLGDEINKLNVEKAEKCNGGVKGEGNSVGSVANSKFNFVFGSSSNLANTFSRSHAVKLSDKMQKMNIHDSQKVDDVDTFKDSNSSSSANFNSKFVFGSDKRTSVSMTGSSRFTSHQFQDANAACPRSGTVVENNEVVDMKNSEEKVFASGNNEKIAGSFGESVEDTIPNVTRNRDTRSGVGLFRGQNIPSCSSSEILGKENQPINLTEKSMYGKQYLCNQLNYDSEVYKSSFPSSSRGFCFHPFDSVYKASTGDKVEKKDKEFTFTSTPVQPGASFTGFNTPNLDIPANLFTGLGKKLELGGSNRSAWGRRLKKTREKLRKHTLVKNEMSREFSSQQNAASSDCCSPMDFSPCQEASCASSSTQSTISTKAAYEVLAATRERSDIEEGDKICREPNERGLEDHCETELQTNHRTERVSKVSAGVATAEAGAGEENDAKAQSCFASNSQNHEERRFLFSTSSSVQNNISATKPRKKYRMKIGRGSDSTTSSWRAEFASSSVKFFDLACNSSQSDELQSQKAGILHTQSRGEHTMADEKQVKQDLTQAAILEACEKWRIRGNQAYRKGSLSKAENLYTKCIDSITHIEAPECCIEPLVLCYSNRAATRLSLGRVREALGDCKRAASLDSNFRKVHMRAANCHLVLGEVEDAILYFNKCLESGVDVCLDRRTMVQAADGLQKSEKVVKCINHSAELLQQRTSDAASNALTIITEALSISSYSEKLLKMKGEALCMLRKYEEVVPLCEQTLGFAEKNFGSIDPAIQLSNNDGSNCNNSNARVWRWRLMSRSYFHMGRLEASLDLIKQQEQLRSVEDKYGSEEKDSSVTLAYTLRELLHLKNAGNKAFQCGKHTEAVEHYTAAILNSVESRPFAAVCFCNRAAAHQALGKISDAIADCSLAIALDGSYGKALSRRATLHEMIRDYEQAANDLRRFISVLQKQSQETNQQSDTPLGKGGSREHLKEARDRLSSMERKANKGTPLDFYLILGVEATDNAPDIKKAYHKAALKHHPDKAGQFLARSESADEGRLRKEIADKIHVDADRFFKMIGEAYAVLSDNSKRSTYDIEEEIRNEKAKNKSSGIGRESNVYSSPFEGRSSSEYGREWRTYGESWKTYGKSSSRW